MKIFVAKLSFNVNDEALTEVFAEFGEVSSARVITDKMTGRSKGYAFVEMSDDEAAKKAIAALNQSEIDGRTVVVTEAEERPAGERRQGGYSNNRGGYDNQNRRY